jgi:hypothetical protein
MGEMERTYMDIYSLYKKVRGLDSWLEEPFLLFLGVKTLNFVLQFNAKVISFKSLRFIIVLCLSCKFPMLYSLPFIVNIFLVFD